MSVAPQLPWSERLARRAGERALVLCAGLDPSPDALALLERGAAAARLRPGRDARVTRAAAIERLCGLVVESVRDHAVAVKPQLAWFEHAGPDGLRALERTVAFARAAGLLVVLDGKRGDVPHSAAAYADAWLGEDAASGIAGDALTVNAWMGTDALDAMVGVAQARGCGLYALALTSNPGAERFQAAPGNDGLPWWHAVATQLAARAPLVGAVVGATRPDQLAEARALMPGTPLLVPGIGAQGGGVGDLHAMLDGPADGPTSAPGAPAAAPPTLVAAARSLLPARAADTAGFRHAVATAAAALAGELATAPDGSRA